MIKHELVRRPARHRRPPICCAAASGGSSRASSAIPLDQRQDLASEERHALRRMKPLRQPTHEAILGSTSTQPNLSRRNPSRPGLQLERSSGRLPTAQQFCYVRMLPPGRRTQHPASVAPHPQALPPCRPRPASTAWTWTCLTITFCCPLPK